MLSPPTDHRRGQKQDLGKVIIVMKFLPQLFANNRAWAERMKLVDPQYFQRLSQTQTPQYLWIGCADSLVPANEIVGLGPGELFVHRNIANIVPPFDTNVRSVLQFAVDALRVKHIIVCGHYGCGGVLAALRDWSGLPLENWLAHIRAVYRAHKDELDAAPSEEMRWRRLCELNVRAQVHAVRETEVVKQAWRKDQPVMVHGWIYDLREGLLRDLDMN
jgi:carbonic anhydrase